MAKKEEWEAIQLIPLSPTSSRDRRELNKWVTKILIRKSSLEYTKLNKYQFFQLKTRKLHSPSFFLSSQLRLSSHSKPDAIPDSWLQEWERLLKDLLRIPLPHSEYRLCRMYHNLLQRGKFYLYNEQQPVSKFVPSAHWAVESSTYFPSLTTGFLWNLTKCQVLDFHRSKMLSLIWRECSQTSIEQSWEEIGHSTYLS